MNQSPMNEEYYEVLINIERQQQDNKWGIQSHKDIVTLAIVLEEIGEVAKEIVEDNRTDTDKELIQVGALIKAWLTSINRLPPDKEKDHYFNLLAIITAGIGEIAQSLLESNYKAIPDKLECLSTLCEHWANEISNKGEHYE